MGFIKSIFGGSPKQQPVATPSAADQAAAAAATPAAKQEAADADARAKLLAINAGAVQGQATGPGGDLTTADTTRKKFLGL